MRTFTVRDRLLDLRQRRSGESPLHRQMIGDDMPQ
jgi:hypothetical protein